MSFVIESSIVILFVSKVDERFNVAITISLSIDKGPGNTLRSLLSPVQVYDLVQVSILNPNSLPIRTS
jgi:hypothetical protein